MTETEKAPSIDSRANHAGRFSLRRRWVRRSLAAAVAIVVLAVVHRPLLRGAAEFLIVARPVDQAAERADFIVLLPEVVGNSTALDQVAQSFSAGEVRGILVFDSPRSRGVRCGAWSDRPTELRRDLTARGIPAAAIVMPPGQCRTSWDAADAIRRWLNDRPKTQLVVLGRLLHGRYDRRVFNSTLDPAEALGIRFAAIHSGVDQNNWWHSREGIQLIFQNYVALTFDWWNGPSKPCHQPWTLEEFENSLPPVAGK